MTLSTKFEIATASRPKEGCRHCGESDPAAVNDGCCYECYLQRVSKPTTESHHVFGRDEPVTVDIPANVHRAFNMRQAARQPLLKKKSSDPVREVSRVVTTAAEFVEVVADRIRRTGKFEWLPKIAEVIATACRKGADWLLALQGWLVKNLGEDWYQDADLPSWT